MQVFLVLLRLLVYIALPASFFLWLSIKNPQLLNVNRTSVVTFFLFIVLMLLFLRIYGGYDIGKKKNKPILYNMSIATFLTDVAVYTQLQIMNVNSANQQTFKFFDFNIILLAMALITQITFLALLVCFGNNIYFRIHPPQSCCIITSEQTDYSSILEKIGRFKLQYSIKDHIEFKDANVQAAIDRNQVVFLFDVPAEERSRLVEYCYRESIDVYYVPSVYDIISNSSSRHIIDDIPLFGNEGSDISALSRLFKRSLDLSVTLPVILLSCPLMLLIAFAIKICDRGPVFYKQQRLTRGGRVFSLYKFRSMIVDAEQDGIARLACENDNRITPVGSVLRRLRFDELPQLFNILKGDMSWVGPRPERPEISRQYERTLPEFSLRLKAKAGLTGYAQVFGKYNTPPREKLLMDLFYIENQNSWLDISLLFKTFTVLFKKDSSEALKERDNLAEYNPNGDQE